jgi:hypothetical protein
VKLSGDSKIESESGERGQVDLLSDIPAVWTCGCSDDLDSEVLLMLDEDGARLLMEEGANTG